MKRLLPAKLGQLALALLVLLPGIAAAAERVGDFSLLDQLGNYHNMRWLDNHDAIALLVQANGDAATRQAIPEFIELQRQYESQGIQFFMINPMGKSNRNAVVQELAKFATTIPVLMDDTQLISEALGIETTAEVLLYDPESFSVEFRGPTGPALEQAINEILAGSRISAPVVAVEGSKVSYPARQKHHQSGISYEQEVAPILAENCAGCHREGGIAPFALDGYSMVRGWSPMIREVLMTKRMPPGQVDPHVGEFTNGRTLDVADAQKILHWIEAGSPRDADSEIDPLAALNWPETRWSVAGEPDLIVKIPAQSVPATGVIDYRYIDVPTGLTEDRWVRASEFIPGDRTVLHHAVANLGGEARRDPDAVRLNRYVPGAQPRIEPPNTGGLLKAGTVLNVQLHYTTSGKESVDESEVGIWFYPEGVIPEERMQARLVGKFANDWEEIPPYSKHFEMSNSFVMPEDADVYGYHPHMHFRGKDLRMYADYPDGTREELINVSNYHYAWQLTYNVVEPKFIPKGTKITSVGHFDNSTQNLANPDPSRAIPWGEQSWDEMFFGEIIWKSAKD